MLSEPCAPLRFVLLECATAAGTGSAQLERGALPAADCLWNSAFIVVEYCHGSPFVHTLRYSFTSQALPQRCIQVWPRPPWLAQKETSVPGPASKRTPVHFPPRPGMGCFTSFPYFLICAHGCWMAARDITNDPNSGQCITLGSSAICLARAINQTS